MKNIVIFASGTGSNAENIIRHFTGNAVARVASVFCNKPDAPVIGKAVRLGVGVEIFDRGMLADGTVAQTLSGYKPDLIVLAGFLWKFPESLIDAYPKKIINIHPALLPKFGGKGMYGMNVHRAVIENREAETGITIHYVDAHYDEGDVIFQKSVAVHPGDSCDDVAEKVRELEREHFPKVIEGLIDDGKPQ
jgi:phosphoribosylglycinamide formyltransferase-1